MARRFLLTGLISRSSAHEKEEKSAHLIRFDLIQVMNSLFFLTYVIKLVGFLNKLLRVYSTANPHVSSTACVSLSYISWYESYMGRSIRLKQVCALGRFWSGASAVR